MQMALLIVAIMLVYVKGSTPYYILCASPQGSAWVALEGQLGWQTVARRQPGDGAIPWACPISEQVFWVVGAIRLLDLPTGREVVVDEWASRMRRMKRRLSQWARWAPVRDVDYVIVHLTYAPGYNWEPRHISGFMYHVRKHLGERLLGYAWVAEMQGRGAVHYHVVLAVRRGARIPFPDRSGWWPFGLTRVELAKSPLGYLMDYARKIRQKVGYPRGIRIFAVVWYKIAGDSAFLLRFFSLPWWLLEAIGRDVGWFWAILHRVLPRRYPGAWEFAGKIYVCPYVFKGVL